MRIDFKGPFFSIIIKNDIIKSNWLEDRKLKKLMYILTCLIILMMTVPVWAENDKPDIIGSAAIVEDVETGTVLYEKNIEEKHYPASITKIMTALVVLDERELDDSVTYSEEALNSIESGSSAAYIKPGEIMTIEQSLYVMMLHSANDVAHGLAYEVGGDLTGFAKLMNEKAVKLGCKNTHFVNASGLHDNNHYTTASDMAKIAAEAYHNEVLQKIMGTEKYELAATNKYSEVRPWINGNRMIREGSEYFYEPCLGGKTGYTMTAGGTLVTYAKIKDRVLECVILKSNNSASAYEDSIKLYKYVKENADFSVFEKTTEQSEKKQKTTTATEIEKILYSSQDTKLKKFIMAFKIAVIIFLILCISVIIRIIHVQRIKKKRRQQMKRRRQQQRRKR